MGLTFTRPAAVLILIFAVFANIFGQSSFSQALQRRAIGSPVDTMGFTMPMMGTGLSPDLGGYGYNRSFAQNRFNSVLPYNNWIDENEYMIGAGDVFFITAIESPSIKYTAAVDQNGKAYIQNIGLIEIGKVSYAESKKVISEYISSKLKKPSEIYVSLIQIKNANVSFTGMINSPGSGEFPGDTRLLDAIVAANRGELPPTSEANLRQVMVQSTNTDSIACYDLLAYLHLNDKSQNPYIYPGDRVRINPTTIKVFVGGAITTPTGGFYPIKEGETLGGFLSMFTLDNTADTNNIIVFKTTENSERILTEAWAEHILNDLDAITIPIRKNHPGIFTASIAGEIASPGHYPIIENTTTARHLIDKAGGLKSSANYDQAVIIRQIKNLPEKFNAGAPQTLVVRPERGASITMASSSADYAIVRLILYNADKVIVEPGDHIFIPKKESFVYLSGSVKNPGAYPFLPSKDVRYYVTQAGGFSGNADKSNIQVYLKYGDAIQSVEPRCIEPGSVIVVPASTQYKVLTQVVLPILSTLATTIGVGLAIYNSR
jgi:protein involved in polysaccharide export with SLBB domain